MRTCLARASSTENRALRFMRFSPRCSPRARQRVWPFEGTIHSIHIRGEHQGKVAVHGSHSEASTRFRWLSALPLRPSCWLQSTPSPSHGARATHHAFRRARFARPEAHCVWAKWERSVPAATRAGAWRPFSLTTASGCDNIFAQLGVPQRMGLCGRAAASHGRLAQLARAPARHAGGQRFKSSIAHRYWIDRLRTEECRPSALMSSLCVCIGKGRGCARPSRHPSAWVTERHGAPALAMYDRF